MPAGKVHKQSDESIFKLLKFENEIKEKCMAVVKRMSV